MEILSVVVGLLTLLSYHLGGSLFHFFLLPMYYTSTCRGYRVGANLWRMAWRRFWRISDSAGRSCQGSMVCRLPAGFAAGRRQSDLSKGCRQIRRSSGAARFDVGYDWRRGIRRHGHALQRSRLRGAVQSLFGVYEKIRRIVSASIVKPLHESKILLVFRGFHYRRATS